MAPPKIKTIQAKFGFADPDLKKPLHDAMIKWIEANVDDIVMEVIPLSFRPKALKIKWEAVVRMTAGGGQFIGFIDLMAIYGYQTNVEGIQYKHIVFEAKTEIASLGELFRQVNLYREGYIGENDVRTMPFIIVCPDDENSELIRQQGFLFYKYEPEKSFGLGGV